MEWPDVAARPTFYEDPQHAPSKTRARFVDGVGDRTRNISYATAPGASRHRSSASRRRHSTYHHDYDGDVYDDNPYESRRSNRPNRSYSRHRVESSHGGTFDDEDWDPFMSNQERVLPSLTFDIKFHRVEPSTEPKPSNSSKAIEQTSRRNTYESAAVQDYRHKLYHENVYGVIDSRYAGGVRGREDSSVELVTGHAQDISGKGFVGLLRWIQIERQYPSFDSFLEYVARLEFLDEETRRDTNALLQEVREKHEKPLRLPQGMKGKYMEANMTDHPVLSSDANFGQAQETTKDRTATLLCMPYFFVAPYVTEYPSNVPNFHPMRTLLQSSFISTPKKRDLQQAICNLENPEKGHCFHVPQIWCLILGDDLLITCTHSPGADVKRGLGGIKVMPASTSNKEPHIRVSDGGTRVWILPITACTTWLEFVANFGELSLHFDNHYQVLLNSTVVTTDSWTSVIDRARRMTIELTLRFKRSNSAYNEYSTSSSDSDSSKDSDSDVLASLQASLSHDRQSASANQPYLDPRDSNSTPRDNNLLDKRDRDFHGAQSGRAGQGNPEIRAPDAREWHSASLDEPHVFIWYAAFPNQREPVRNVLHTRSIRNNSTSDERKELATPTFRVDADRLEDIFSMMHDSLCAKKFKKHREYMACSSATIQDIDTTLAQLLEKKKMQERAREHPGRRSHGTDPINVTHLDPDTVGGQSEGHRNDIQEDRSSSDTEEIIVERRNRRSSDGSEDAIFSRRGSDHLKRIKKFIRIAKALFELFLPLQYSSKMTAKYWGPIQVLIQDDKKFNTCFKSLSSRKGFPNYAAKNLGDIALSKIIIDDLTQERAPLPWKLVLPEGLMGAWPRLVMFFVLSAAKQHREAYYELVKFRDLAYGSRAQLMKSLAHESLHRREAVLPLGIASLVIKNLLGDVTLGLPDIVSTYSEYLDKLEHELISNPYSRVHQEKLLRFRQEAGCALTVLEQQLDCVRDLNAQVVKEAVDMPRWFQKPREHYILQGCVSSIEERIQQFLEMKEHAAELRSSNIDLIESNKDRQEAAILIFTAVTIIFLPLSFVASVFGMNTYDIRNMGKQQWVFWASAIPVTLLVMCLSVIAIRYWDPVRQTWSDFAYRKEAEEPTAVAERQYTMYPDPNLYRRPTMVPNQIPPPPYPQYGPAPIVIDNMPSRHHTNSRPHQRSSHRR